MCNEKNNWQTQNTKNFPPAVVGTRGVYIGNHGQYWTQDLSKTIFGQIFITLDTQSQRSNFQVTKFNVTTFFQKIFIWASFWKNWGESINICYFDWMAAGKHDIYDFEQDKMEEHPIPDWDT